MGVIKRQGIKQSIVNYAGVFLAAFSTIFIYVLDQELYGAARFVIDTAFLLSPFILLGATSVAIRYFPIFKNEENGHNGLLSILGIQFLIGGIIVIAVLFLFRERIFDLYADKSEIFTSQFFKIAILALIIALFNMLYSYTSNFKRIVVPSIFLNLIKVSLPILVLLCYYEYVPFSFLINGVLGTYILALLGILIYLSHLGQLKFNFKFDIVDKPLMKGMSSFAMFSLLSGMGSMLAFKIDSLMVSTLIDFENNGVYTIALFIGNAIAIPTTAILQIASPIVADAIKNKDIPQVDSLYGKSSLNLLIFGVLLFVLVMAGILDLFHLMPTDNFDIHSGYYIVMAIGLAKLVDMATSINSQIINYSKYYKFNVVAILLMAVINIILNLVLIPKYQVIGAAMATFLSLTIYNLIKLVFIYTKFKIQPFSVQTLWVLGIGLLSFGIAYFIPDTGQPFLNLVLKSMVIAAIYLTLTLRLKVSEDINEMWQQIIQKFGLG